MKNGIVHIGGGALGIPDSVLRMDSRQAAALRNQINVQKLDAQTPGQGRHLARDLEFIYDEVLREEFPPTNAMTMIPVDASVPPGADTHIVRRISAQGEAQIHGGNAPVSRVSVSQEEERFAVKHYTVGIGFDVFDLAASNFANSKLRQELQDAAQVVIAEFLNQKTWFGDDEAGIYGVLNYPWLPKMVLPLKLEAGADGDAVLAQLNAAANYGHEESKTVYAPNSVVMSPRAYRYLATTRVVGSVSDTFLLDMFKKANPRIQSVEFAWELQGVGPGGTDGILFYRRDRRSIANVIPQGFTMLPMQQSGFEHQIPCYMSHGGVIMRDVLNNLLAFAEVE